MTTSPTINRAVGAVAGMAMDQLRDLTVAQLDRWADHIHQRLHDHETAQHDTEHGGPTSGNAKSLIIGAVIGVAVALLITEAQAARE